MKPRHSLFFLFSFLIVSVISCIRPDSENVIKGIRQDPSAGSFIEGVPFFPQEESMCGPASLASVISYWGPGADMKEVAKEVYEEKLKGTLPMDILIYAKEKGLDARYYKGGLEDLKKRTAEKTPLILFLNLGYEFYPAGHYIVVTGYNEKARSVLAHSGLKKDAVFTYDELVRDWGKTGFSTILIKPKGRPE